jgi:hypothetical protein
MKLCKSKYCIAFYFFILIIIYHVIAFTGQDGWDAVRYAENAANLVHGKELLNHHFSYRLVPVFLTAFSYLLFGINDFSTAFFPMLITLASLLLLVNLLKNYPSYVIATALVIYSFTLINLIYFDKLLPDLFVSFFYLLTVKLLRDINFNKRAGWKHFFGLAVSFFCVFLTKGTVIFLIPLYAVFIFLDVFKRKKNISQWIFFVFVLLLFTALYFEISKIITGNYLTRFHTIKENGYLNRCSYDVQPKIFLIKRLLYEWFVAEINATVLFPVIFLIPYWVKKKFWSSIFLFEHFFYAFIAFILIVSSNFMSISVTSYIPLCPDPRHFLFLIPILALAASNRMVYFFSEEVIIPRNTKEYAKFYLLLLGLFLTITFFTSKDSFYYFYLPMFLLVISRIYINNRIILYLFWTIWLILPVKYAIYAKEVNFNLQKEWLFKLKELPNRATVISNKVQKHYWRYYNEFDKNPNVQFFSYQEIDSLPHDLLIPEDSVYLWLNFYTRFLSNQTDANLPLYVSDTANYLLVKSYPKRGMFLYKMPKSALEKKPFYATSNNYEKYDANHWQLNKQNIANSIEQIGEFSSCFYYTFDSTISDKLMLEVSFRLNAKDNDNLQFVISIEDKQGNSFFWKGIPLAKDIHSFNSWWKISVKETVYFKPSYANKQLKIYLLNSAQSQFWVDDWKIKLYR